MSDQDNDTWETVASLLAAHGIQPGPDEMTAMVAEYPRRREAVARLYRMTGVRYEDPAVTFARKGVS